MILACFLFELGNKFFPVKLVIDEEFRGICKLSHAMVWLIELGSAFVAHVFSKRQLNLIVPCVIWADISNQG